jgi:serine/threonine protein phosphatase PrpC/serine/threonine protein kinase
MPASFGSHALLLFVFSFGAGIVRTSWGLRLPSGLLGLNKVPPASIPFEDLQQGGTLGKGSYGEVREALLHGTPVVMKKANGVEANASSYLGVEEWMNRYMLRSGEECIDRSVAPFLGASEESNSGVRWLIWRRIGGGTLHEAIKSGRLMEVLRDCNFGADDPLIGLLRCTAQSLSCLHRMGIVHRDVKPANLLLDAGTVRIIDFGSAAHMSGPWREGYKRELSPCSPFYSAPEQFVDERRWGEFDVYSLALLWARCAFPALWEEAAWEDFTRELSLSGSDIDIWLQRTLTQDATSDGIYAGLSFFNGADGGRGWRLLKGMLAKDPEKRTSLDAVLSDPYILGAGGTVSAKAPMSRTFFEDVVSSAIDVCPVDERRVTFRVSLDKPMGLRLEEVEGGAGGIKVTGIDPGGAAWRSGILRPGDEILAAGDISLLGRKFDDALLTIVDYPERRVPLVVHRDDVIAITSTLPSASSAVQSMRVVDAGAHSIMNKRARQEDTFALSTFIVTPLAMEEPVPVNLATVFDGHRGDGASHFAADNFPTILRNELARRHRVTDPGALRSAWDILSQQYAATGLQCGSTAAAALVADGLLHTLHCGDSRVVLSARGELALETTDHSASDPAEMARIALAGGEVSCKMGTYRVHAGDWRLNLARSLGGTEWLNAGILPEPDVSSTVLSDVHDAVIVASDGLWTTVDSATAVQLLYQWRSRENITAIEAAQRLCIHASQQGSSDNLTCLVIYLGP